MKTIAKSTPIAAAVACLLAAAAAANQLAGVLITGYVTTTSKGDWVTVDGRSYRVAAGSPSEKAARALVKGQWVDVRLSGPATSASSVVISVTPHQQ